MRLTSHQAEAIKQAAVRVLGLPARVWLFGSRVDDTARGGDIDLLVETDEVLPSRAAAICRLYGALVMALGDRRIDVLVKDGRTPAAPIERALCADHWGPRAAIWRRPGTPGAITAEAPAPASSASGTAVTRSEIG